MERRYVLCIRIVTMKPYLWIRFYRFIMDRLDRHRDNWREAELKIDLGTDFPLTDVYLKVSLKIGRLTFSK